MDAACYDAPNCSNQSTGYTNSKAMKTQRHIGSVTALAVGLLSLACGASVYAQTSAPSTYKHITIDGSFDDWTGVPLAYTATAGPANAIQYENVYVANDENNLYIRFTLYSPRADAFANSYDNLFIDADNNTATGYPVGGIGSEMLVQWGGGYQEKNGGFNEGAVNNLGWAFAGSGDNMDFEAGRFAWGDLCVRQQPGFRQ